MTLELIETLKTSRYYAKHTPNTRSYIKKQNNQLFQKHMLKNVIPSGVPPTHFI